jgi:small subunit ribosomal protein S17
MEPEIKNTEEMENKDTETEMTIEENTIVIAETDSINDTIESEPPLYVDLSGLGEIIVPEEIIEIPFSEDLEISEEPIDADSKSPIEEPVAVENIESTFETLPVVEKEIIKPLPAPKIAEPSGKKVYKRILQGKVYSDKPDKTIIVSIERQVKHPLYKKYYKRTKRVMAHDELNECKTGDTVKVRESRPLSSRKRWELIEVVERAK